MVALWPGCPCLYFYFFSRALFIPNLKEASKGTINQNMLPKNGNCISVSSITHFPFYFPATHFTFSSLSVSLVSEQMSWQNLFAQVCNSLLLLLSHFSCVQLCAIPGILQAGTLEWIAISFSSA